MKHLINLLIAFVALWLFPLASLAQQYTGTSGMAHIPTAEMHHEGDAFIGAHFLNKAMTPDTGFLFAGEKYNTFDYYVALTPFSWIEMSYVCTERIHAKDEQTGHIKWSKDRYASVKIQPLKEGKYYPALAIGCNDVLTSAFFKDKPDVQLYFTNAYVAATKTFNFSGNELGMTVAYRHFFRNYNAKWNGIVGGITFRPSFFPQWRLMAEYTGNEFLLGTDVLLWQHLRLQASLKDFKHANAGLCLQFNLLGKKYRY
ncbi:MAG: YjbH domain-containing protein [Bacteroidales bacterium]|nr:YjbH domain-containing protein [Bacteroidales bacterium]